MRKGKEGDSWEKKKQVGPKRMRAGRLPSYSADLNAKEIGGLYIRKD